MAVITEQVKVACSIKLNGGFDETGKTITKSISLGSLKENAFDTQKAMNIVNLLRPVLELPVLKVQNTVTNELSEGE